MNHFEVIKRFIYEEGKEKGAVSGDMALQSLKAIKTELELTDKLLEDYSRLVKAIPECVAHGNQCIPHALEWVEQIKTLGKVITS